jgi:agmatinase
MVEVEQSRWDTVVADSIKQAKTTRQTFISFDISVLEPSYASGAGRPVPGGLTILQARTLVRRLCAETEMVGFEMLDLAPYLVICYKTALNANYIMHTCLTEIAMRKTSLTKANPLDPLALSQ